MNWKANSYALNPLCYSIESNYVQTHVAVFYVASLLDHLALQAYLPSNPPEQNSYSRYDQILSLQAAVFRWELGRSTHINIFAWLFLLKMYMYTTKFLI